MRLSKVELILLLCLSLMIMTSPYVFGQHSPMINNDVKPLTPIRVNRNYLIDTWMYIDKQVSNDAVATNESILLKITNDRLTLIDCIDKRKLSEFISLGTAVGMADYNDGDLMYCKKGDSDIWILYYDDDKDAFILYNSFTEQQAYLFNLSSKENKS